MIWFHACFAMIFAFRGKFNASMLEAFLCVVTCDSCCCCVCVQSCSITRDLKTSQRSSALKFTKLRSREAANLWICTRFGLSPYPTFSLLERNNYMGK